MKCKTCKNREIMVEIFCTCRMPWRKAKNNIYAKQMVECSKCGEWFHRMCERIPEDIFMKQNKDRMSLQKLFKLKVKPQFSHHLIRKSEHCQSVKRIAENIDIDMIFSFVYLFKGSKCGNLQVCTQFILILCMCILQLLGK